MAPVQSRLVVALSVPVATLALILSLVWLKRRHRSGRPIDKPPSGSLPETISWQSSKNLPIPEETAEEKKSKLYLEDSQASSIQDLTEDYQEEPFLSKSSDSGVSSEPEFELEPLFAEYETVILGCTPKDFIEIASRATDSVYSKSETKSEISEEKEFSCIQENITYSEKEDLYADEVKTIETELPLTVTLGCTPKDFINEIASRNTDSGYSKSETKSEISEEKEFSFIQENITYSEKEELYANEVETVETELRLLEKALSLETKLILVNSFTIGLPSVETVSTFSKGLPTTVTEIPSNEKEIQSVDKELPSAEKESPPIETDLSSPDLDLPSSEGKIVLEKETPQKETAESPSTKTNFETTVKICSVKVLNIENIPSEPTKKEVFPSLKKSKGLKKKEKSVSISEVVESKIEVPSKEDKMEGGELAEKLANLELDTMKLNSDKETGERDSANHSPSEVMLASPSISNFSDAHSEGSSDSGKGHSDVATSPSRTPAGGSSVAGDLIPTIYEFIVPQVIVGRLIGRHGSFLQEIMSTTHTNIFIKKHPESSRLKVCAIEGPQQDIDKALEMIRQKFPSRRYPKLTLERVSFVNMEQAQLRPEDFHLQLIEGVNNDVVLSSLISAGHFFVQQPSHPSYTCLTNLTQAMTQAYSSPEAPVLTTPVKDAVCVAPSMGGWYRVQIVSIDEDTSGCDIKFVDYGGYMRVETSCLKQIRADFLLLPFQAVECCLANIVPISEEGWSEEARILVHNLTFGRVLQAQVCNYSEEGIPLVNLYTSVGPQVVLVNNELVANGFACFLEQDEEEK